MRNISHEAAVKFENTIIRVIIRDALAAGCSISVETYGEDEITKSRQINKIVAALRATDYDNLNVYNANGKYVGGVTLVYGNEPYEVISDYSVSLESLMENANAKATEIESRLT